MIRVAKYSHLYRARYTNLTSIFVLPLVFLHLYPTPNHDRAQYIEHDPYLGTLKPWKKRPYYFHIMKPLQVARCVSTKQARAIISPEAREYLDDVTQIPLEQQTAVNGSDGGPSPALSPPPRR